MVRVTLRRSLVAACLLVFALNWNASPVSVQRRSEWQWDNVGRVVALGDVHGRYDQLVALLRGAGLADPETNWVGGRAHLVLCGDMVDRGPDDRAVLDAVRRLQAQAESAGGKVHTLLGNHEVMNLVRDFRYVSTKAFAAFAEDERGGDRQSAWRGYQQARSKAGVTAAQLQAAFDEAYPPGYFGRQQAFDERGNYGRWLLEQPAVVKVNGIVFLHGGLTPEVAALGLDQINRRVRDGIRTLTRAQRDLSALVLGPAAFPELLGAAQQISQGRADGRPVDPTLAGAARALIESLESLPMATDGPLWYRGNSLSDERIERERVTDVLAALDATGMSLGHTVTRTERISSRFNGRVYRADVGMGLGRPGLALVIDERGTRVFDSMTGTYSDPVTEPAYGEGWAAGYEHLSDNALERVLSTAEVADRIKVERDGQTAELWEVQSQGVKLRAVFKNVTAAPPPTTSPDPQPVDRYQHEIAAYRLDRQLGLRFVPVAIDREFEGRQGALRAVVETAIDAVSLRSYLNLETAETTALIRGVAQKYGVEQAELEEQVLRARVFDGLIGNLRRQPSDALFVVEEGRLALVNHQRAFTTSPEIAAVVLENCRPLPADLAYALTALDRGGLTASLGNYLSSAQIDALLVRRGRLLEACGTGPKQPQ